MYSVRISVISRKFGAHNCKRGLASVAKDFTIPVIDFAKYRASASEQQKKETARSIVNAFKTSGFIYVDRHGIPTGMSNAKILGPSNCYNPEEKVQNTFKKVRTLLLLSL